MTGARASRAETPRRRLRSPLRGRRRALLCLSAAAALAAGTGVRSTLATFTDTAAISGSTFRSGTIDLTLNGMLGGAANINGSYQFPGLVLATAAPGEAYALQLQVANAGTLPLIYTVTGTATGGLAASVGMQYYLAVSTTSTDTTATNSGSAATGTRVANCGTTKVTDSNTTAVTGTAATFVSGRPLAVGATDYLCIAERLHSSAADALQGATSVATFTFSGRQAS